MMPYKPLIYLVLLLSTCWLGAQHALAVQANDWNSNGDSFASDNAFENSATEPEFLPVEEAYQLDVESNERQILLSWQIAEGYYLYGHRFKFALSREGKPITIKAEIPRGKEKHDEYFGDVEVHYFNAQISIPLPKDISGPLHLKVQSQGCADAGLCYPPYKQAFDISPSLISVSSADGALAANSKTGAGSASPTGKPGSTNNNARQFSDASLPYILLIAALGGIILNLMPCVFPILTLKVLSFTNTDENHDAGTHGLIYTLGVVISFVVVASILIALKASGEAIGWGFHLQSPVFVAGLTYLFLVLGLSMSGMLEFGARFMGLGSGLAEQSGYKGSFFTGVLAVVVASPCTAPFMGTALGYAMSQPPIIALSVFAALGFGMALPFLLLSYSPALIRYMPRPGAWMDTFKRLMAFPLYATCVWLLWVIGNQTGVNGMAMALLGCLLITIAAWVWHETQVSKHWRRLKMSVSAAAAIAALLILSSSFLTPMKSNTAHASSNDWHPYSAEVLQQVRDTQQPIFLNITADWCITCLANEKVALGTDEVKKLFRDKGIVYLKGDWTNHDPEITRLLGQYGRNGIPLYLLFPGDADAEATVLPQLLTVNIVKEAIAKL